MYTTHGYHIPGSGDDGIKPDKKARCGGLGLCAQCSSEAAGFDDGREDPPDAEPVKIRDDGIIEG